MFQPSVQKTRDYTGLTGRLLALHFLVMAVLALPAGANAASFLPATDQDFSVLVDTSYDYDSYTIGEGITVNYLTPPAIAISITSDSDIIINGNLNAPDALLSITSLSGNIYLGGTITAYATTITANAMYLNQGTGSGTTGGGSAGSISVQGTGSLTIDAPYIEPGILLYSDPSNIFLSSNTTRLSPGNVTYTLQAVPLPAPAILMISGLLGFSLFRKLRFTSPSVQ